MFLKLLIEDEIKSIVIGKDIVIFILTKRSLYK